KITGKKAKQHYNGLLPEFAVMSLKPGIGKPWLDKYASDVLQRGTTILRGRENKSPRYYDDKLELTHKALVEKYKRERTRLAKAADNTNDRLLAKEQIARSQIAHQKRDLR